MDLKEQIITFIDESVTEAFTAMMLGEPTRSNEIPNTGQPRDIVCSIGFTGKIEGAFTICSSNDGACKVVSKMLGMEVPEVTSDVTDGIGEITNIIVGGVKNRLSALNYDFDISVPTLISAQDLEKAISEDRTEVKSCFFWEDLEFGVIAIYKIIGEDLSVSSEGVSLGADDEKAASSGEPLTDAQPVQETTAEAWSALNNLVQETKEDQAQADAAPAADPESSAAERGDDVSERSSPEAPAEREEAEPVPAPESLEPSSLPVEKSVDPPAAANQPPLRELPAETDASIDFLVEAAGEKIKREKGKEGAKSAASALSALVQSSEAAGLPEGSAQDVTTPLQQSVSSGVLPKAKAKELFTALENIPGDHLTKEQVRMILENLLAHLSGGDSQASLIVAQVDEALLKLDRIINKIKGDRL